MADDITGILNSGGISLSNALPSINNALNGYTSAPSSTTSAPVSATTSAPVVPAAQPASTTSTWGAIGEFFALISDVQRMATIAAGIVFLLAGLWMFSNKEAVSKVILS